MTTSHNKIPMFSKEYYDDWKIRMQAHLAAQDDDMWSVITEGPLKIMNPNLAFAISGGEPQFLEKSRHEYMMLVMDAERVTPVSLIFPLGSVSHYERSG
ncbi:hypothetical protein F511_10858 [Dorcoceras hygrometricum]|uniref:Uncharacterized protein n=1 Tax=Dorcoceras hygrometricum TaxID=472368 RepID=A0A2Z7ABP5_9LAMI|nr:hypothetical protein F511_10858 [Dorcoceras hygrometricum]